MNNARGNPPSPWKERLRPLASELNRTVELRRRLAALELAHDRQLLRRGVIVGGIGAVMALAGLPMLLQAAARGLATVTLLSITSWMVIVGGVLLVPGLLLLAHTIRKTRSGFCGLQGTLSELHEDLVWLREWTQAEDSETDSAREGETSE